MLLHVGFGFTSRVFHSRVFSLPSVDMDERALEVARIFNKHSKCCNKFILLTMSSYAFISLLYKQLLRTVHAVENFHCTIRFINQICKEVPDETFSISFRFHKIVHENTLLWHRHVSFWVSRAMQKHTLIVLTAFCQCSSFVVNGITEI